MALTREQSQIWQAMNIGPQWILRDRQDPLLDAVPAVHQTQEPAPVARPTSSVARTESVAGHHLASSAPEFAARNASVPRRPLATPAATPKVVRVDAALAAEVKTASWQDIAKIVDRCTVCSMAAERTHTVCADGAPGCPVVIVGEAPGRDEDIEGIPFVGKSGQLLTAILDVVGLKRQKDVAIVNVLKCRPQKNRNPAPDEIQACSAFLDRQLELLAPKVLVLMGRFAVERILGKTEKIADLRNATYSARIAGREVPCIVTYHPSYLLRSPVEKEKSWHDLLRVRKLLESLADQ